MEKRTLLKKFFGHSAFRGGQEALIDAILSGRDVLGVMPTGGGKSICYQIPALMLPGLTIVVSPLISLMKDQVAALTEAGVPAAFLNSSLSLEQLRETYAKTAREQYKLLYVAPERLENESFLSLISHVPVSLLAVDEAHCISQWGQDFRPSYLKIADFIAQLPTRPVVAAFTATATKQVRADIISQLGLRNPLLNITGFDRPNLYFAVQHPTSKLAAVWQLVRERSEKSGIVYCNTRASVERVCEFLNDKGIAATRYHAGLSEEERLQDELFKTGFRNETNVSAWALTSRTSASSSTTTCQNRWKATIRRPGARAVTEATASAFCSTPPAMCRRRAFSSRTAATKI